MQKIILIILLGNVFGKGIKTESKKPLDEIESQATENLQKNSMDSKELQDKDYLLIGGGVVGSVIFVGLLWIIIRFIQKNKLKNITNYDELLKKIENKIPEDKSLIKSLFKDFNIIDSFMKNSDPNGENKFIEFLKELDDSLESLIEILKKSDNTSTSSWSNTLQTNQSIFNRNITINAQILHNAANILLSFCNNQEGIKYYETGINIFLNSEKKTLVFSHYEKDIDNMTVHKEINLNKKNLEDFKKKIDHLDITNGKNDPKILQLNSYFKDVFNTMINEAVKNQRDNEDITITYDSNDENNKKIFAEFLKMTYIANLKTYENLDNLKNDSKSQKI